MSKYYRISLICVMAVAMIALCILLYRYEEHSLLSDDYTNIHYSLVDNASEKIPDTLEETDLSASAESGDKVTEDTELVIIEYYPDGMSRQYITLLPEEFVGRNRKEIEQFLDDYCVTPEMLDIEKGLYRIEMTSFSAQSVTIEKSYHKPPTDYFFLAFADDCVVVYLEDKTTILLVTDIHRDQLSETLIQEILHYKLIAGNAELFDFLEAYTS